MGYPPMISLRVAFNFCRGFLLRLSYVLMLWSGLRPYPCSQQYPPFTHFFRIACAFPRAGVGFFGGWGLLTCLCGQLIYEGVDFIAEHEIFLLYCVHCVGEGGVVGDNVSHIVGKEQIGGSIVRCGSGNVSRYPLNISVI